MYNAASLSLNPYVDGMNKAKDFITSAKNDMTTFLGHDIMTDPRIRHFFMMKDATLIPDNDKTRYMRLGGNGIEREYQNRVRDGVKLPSVENIIKGEPVTYSPKEQKRQKQSGGYQKNNNSYEGRYQRNFNNQGKKCFDKESSETKYKDNASLGNYPFANFDLNNGKKR